jgi:hypothetical protein
MTEERDMETNEVVEQNGAEIVWPVMTTDKAEQLRAPFPPETIGKLPRVTCKACRDHQFKVCDKHTRQRCGECQNNMTDAHIHLDYVGHAAVTDRLLRVDPTWTWEPVAWSPDGGPAIQRGDKRSRMWIKMTVCGVTRLGVGIADSWKEELEKELISDALRNAAMRFGVALDLWSKEDLAKQATAHEDGPPPEATRAPGATPDESEKEAVDRINAVRERVDALSTEERAAFTAWKEGQHFQWPWPKAVTAVMHRKIDEIVGHVDPPGPDAEPVTGTPEPVTEGQAGTPESLPPAEGLPVDGPCELCGSTRAAKAIVHGTRRCQNVHDCTKRIEKAAEERATASTSPSPDSPVGGDPTPDETPEAQAGAVSGDPGEVQHSIPTDGPPIEPETGSEVLYCAGCGEAIVGELPTFGDGDEPYHVAHDPAYGG